MIGLNNNKGDNYANIPKFLTSEGKIINMEQNIRRIKIR